MSNASNFDPYLNWLGIRDAERPPNHYRLLGLELFESDPNIISSAADRQMAHVRTYQAGAFSEDSQRLLNELMTAKICLLKADRKADYDKLLRAQSAAKEAQATQPATPIHSESSDFTPKSSQPFGAESESTSVAEASQFFQPSPSSAATKTISRPSTTARAAQRQNPALIYGVVAGLVLAVIVITIALASLSSDNTENAQPTKPAIAKNIEKKPPEVKTPQPEKMTPTPPAPAPMPVPRKVNPGKVEVKPVAPSEVLNKTNDPKPDPVGPREPSDNNSQSSPSNLIDPGIDLGIKEPGPTPNENKPPMATVPEVPKEDPALKVVVKPNNNPAKPANPVNEDDNFANAKKRRPVPKPDEISDRRKRIRNNYKEEYAKKDDDKMVGALATKLTDLGSESKDDPATMYVFYDEARSVAANVGNPKIMILAHDRLVENFDLPEGKELVKTLNMTNVAEMNPEEVVQLYIYTCENLIAALEKDDADLADSLVRIATTLNNRSLPIFRSRGESMLKDYASEISDIRKNAARIRKVKETLEQTPDDATANNEYGKYLFLTRSHHTEALTYLAKGADKDLKKLAEDELNGEKNPAAICALAERWWECSPEKANADARTQLKIHACVLYSSVITNLKSLDKSQAESRLIELEKDKGVRTSNRNVQKIMTQLLTRGAYRVRWGNNDNSPGQKMKFSPNGTIENEFNNRWEFAKFWGVIVSWHNFNNPKSIFDTKILVGHNLIMVSAQRITIRHFDDQGKAIRQGIGVLAGINDN